MSFTGLFGMFATEAEAKAAAKQLWVQHKQDAQDPGDLLLLFILQAVMLPVKFVVRAL